MRILLDCDGVLADFVGYVLDTILEQTGREYTHADVTEWDFGNLLETAEERRALWMALKAPGVAQELRPIPGAAAAVEALRLAGHDIHVVTSPMPDCPTWTYERELWLRDYMGIERKRVIHASNKNLVAGDVLVDDNWDNVRGWVTAQPDVGDAPRRPYGVLVDAPYNRRPLHGRVVRVAGITDFATSSLARRAA